MSRKLAADKCFEYPPFYIPFWSAFVLGLRVHTHCGYTDVCVCKCGFFKV